APFEIARRRTDLVQDCGGALTDLLAVRAIDDDRGSRRDLAAPSLDVFGRAADCAGNYPFVGFEDRASADIDQQRRGGSAEPAIQIECGYGKTVFVHGDALSRSEWRRAWTIGRLTGCLLNPVLLM